MGWLRNIPRTSALSMPSVISCARMSAMPPEESVVLNYLGYSWVDQGMHLKTAMDYIRKAVKLKPEDGYYVDSLGWAYFRLGNLPAAVENLEHAVELKADDPIITDHLGHAALQ